MGVMLTELGEEIEELSCREEDHEVDRDAWREVQAW